MSAKMDEQHRWLATMVLGLQLSVLGLVLDNFLLVIAGVGVTIVWYFSSFW
ncbi:hypothetical protein [Halopiger djelfimassiliensis]|uniref:hypothetical protein n=1 Tax=Halopiger djelfimassiliensis TaxID=1293047 RepID=UPI000AFB6F0B|nr:hypothetical protein [Halopiger djelfimassiliensis]